MSNIDPSSRKQMVANMSGEFIRATLTSAYDPANLIARDTNRKDIARNCVALAEEHMQALEASFAQPGPDKH